MPEPSKHDIKFSFMKKIKIILPALAFLLAIVSAFATQNAKQISGVQFFWHDGVECQECDLGLTEKDMEICSPINSGQVCQCQDPIQNAGINPTQTDCSPVRYPE